MAQHPAAAELQSEERAGEEEEQHVVDLAKGYVDEEQDRRAIALAYVDSRIVVGRPGQFLEVVKPKGRGLPAMVVPSNMRPAAPYSRSVVYPEQRRDARQLDAEAGLGSLAEQLAQRAVENTLLRQKRAINLIREGLVADGAITGSARESSGLLNHFPYSFTAGAIILHGGSGRWLAFELAQRLFQPRPAVRDMIFRQAVADP